ncbi:MAG: energy transducer TonB [Bryobacteraceae bacterium]
MFLSKHLILFVLSASILCAECDPPHYRESAIFAVSDSVFVQSISMPLVDFTPGKLVCLATSLKERYRDYHYITINIFSSHEASRALIYGQESNRETMATLSQMHAEYSFDADKHEDYVEIMPTGALPGYSFPRPGPFSTRIDLPAETTPHCKLEIDNRCLIALEQFPYPAELLKSQPSGSVTLTATIIRAGKVDHIRVVKAESIPASAAIQNLSSWRLEPGPREESLHITYSYAIDNSLRKMDGMQVQWALPNAVSIRIPHE